MQEQETEVPPRSAASTDQFPPPGSKVEPGAEVTVVVGKRAERPTADDADDPQAGTVRVAVLCGGRSSEHEVSLRSGDSVARGPERGRP